MISIIKYGVLFNNSHVYKRDASAKISKRNIERCSVLDGNSCVFPESVCSGHSR